MIQFIMSGSPSDPEYNNGLKGFLNSEVEI